MLASILNSLCIHNIGIRIRDNWRLVLHPSESLPHSHSYLAQFSHTDGKTYLPSLVYEGRPSGCILTLMLYPSYWELDKDTNLKYKG